MTQRLLLTVLAAFALSAPAMAAKVSGVDVPESAEVAGTKLVLNGAGLRKKFGFAKVYVGALYLPAKSGDADAILSANAPARIALHMLRDVERDKLVAAFDEGFKANNAPDAIKALQSRFGQFLALFGDVKEGDVIALDFVPGTGTQVSVRGQVKGTVAGDDLARALMRIWLGPKPPTPELRSGMLGK
ncbi:MAG TPA: chalcone isomerase family protein [Gammaproteobacteria bacterium]|nr:chalcone isomerase family protein [Gammaproteobacteria bacterium]